MFNFSFCCSISGLSFFHATIQLVEFFCFFFVVYVLGHFRDLNSKILIKTRALAPIDLASSFLKTRIIQSRESKIIKRLFLTLPHNI